MVTFLFSVHTVTEAKQYAGFEPRRSLFQPGHLTWRALVTRPLIVQINLHHTTTTVSECHL